MHEAPQSATSRRALEIGLAVLLGLLFVVLRLYRLDVGCLDGDEIFSLEAALKGWGGLLDFAADDVSHPPLFYLLLKAWIGIGGKSLLWLRLLPCVIGISALLPFGLVCRECKLGSRERNLALALFAANGFLIFHAQHVRNFILLQALCLWSLWLFVRYAQAAAPRRRDVWGLFLVNVLAVYAHYWGFVWVGCEGAILLAWRRDRILPFLFTGILLLACFAPWAMLVLRAAEAKGSATSQVAWITPPAFAELPWFYATLNGPFRFPRSLLVGAALFDVPVLLWAIALLRRGARGENDRAPDFVGLLVFSFLPPLLTFVASHLLPQSVWATRQLILSAVPYFMLVALAASRLRPVPLRALVVAGMVVWASVSCVAAIRGDNVKLPYDQLVRAMVAREADLRRDGPVHVYADEDHFVRVMDLYLEEAGATHMKHIVVRDFSEVNDDRFWVVCRTATWKKGPSPREALEARGYVCGEESSIEDRSQRLIVFPVARR